MPSFPDPALPSGTPEPAGAASGGAPEPKGVVTSLTRDQARARQARSERLRSLPALVVAVLVHGGLLWAWYAFFVEPPAPAELRLLLRASLEEATLEEEQEWLPPEPPLEQPRNPVPDPVVDEVLSPTDVPDPDDIPIGEVATLGMGASGGGGRGLRLGTGGLAADDMGSAGLGVVTDGFRGFVEDLRQRGLDVVFVLDATGSMQLFIERAQKAIGEIMDDLSAVVPSVRLGLVAYRDTGDAWTTRSIDLTGDRWRVHTFLLDLDAAGGKRITPDFEEAVEEGLRVAIEESSWRQASRRVVILVGDAPYHEEDGRQALGLVREFARDPQALVNTLYVGNDPAGRPTENQLRARNVMEQIARAGGGHVFELLSDDEAAGSLLRRRVTDATFGPEWAGEVAAWLASRPTDARLASVRRHVAQGDRRWLLRRLEDDTIHAAVPEALVEVFDGLVARTCLAFLGDPARPAESRAAALYVLKLALPRLRDVPVDVEQPLAGQERALALLRLEVDQVPVAPEPTGRAVSPPPPAPPPAPPPR